MGVRTIPIYYDNLYCIRSVMPSNSTIYKRTAYK